MPLPRASCLFVLISVLAICACTGAVGRPMPEPTPPPGTTLPYPSDGPLMTAALFTLADLRSRLEMHYPPPWDGHRYAVPASLGWAAIVEHYTRELGPNWQIDTRYADDAGKDYRSKVWSDGKRAVAIALNESSKPGAEHALTVLFPDEP
jgi:hypothetical protein